MSAINGPSAVSLKALQKELSHIQEEGVEGFFVKLANDSDLFQWEIGIFGPPQTIYEGGYFKLLMKFPLDYPYSPPSIRFLTKMWHPNIYENGNLCISILHPPVADPHSLELAAERWNPTQNVRTILLSVISLLNEPNTSSPANVDASVQYTRWIEGNGKDYEDHVRKVVNDSRVEAERDNVQVPRTIADYVATKKDQQSENPSDHLSTDLDDYYFYDEDECTEDPDDEDEENSESGDSGTGES